MPDQLDQRGRQQRRRADWIWNALTASLRARDRARSSASKPARARRIAPPPDGRPNPFFTVLGVAAALMIGQGLLPPRPQADTPLPAAIQVQESKLVRSGALSPQDTWAEIVADPWEASDTIVPPDEPPGSADTAEQLPGSAVSETESANEAPPRALPPTLSDYVVEPGDTVNRIASRHGISAQTVVRVNRLPDPNYIQPGQILQIMSVDGTIHQVREGDTATSIAEAYGVALDELLAANQLDDPNTLPLFTVLMVPNPTREPEDKPILACQPARRAELPFIARIVGPAQASQRATGVPASVTIAQAILETAWGTSFLAREANNYFGIKAYGRGGTDGVVWIDTWEVENGENVTRKAPFRKYKTVADSLLDHGWFFHENPRYARALEARGDPREFARRIASAGYATDPAYASKLISLMERYGLFHYDC